MRAALEALFARRIAILDGGMGTSVQSYGLSEAEFRGDAFRDHPKDLHGCNDLLNLTRPAVVREIHDGFLDAGADIIETNTFNATAISLADYGVEDHGVDINRAGARIARAAADDATRKTPDKPRFVAGSMGPTNRTTSIAMDVDNPEARAVSFADMRQAYFDQARGLLDGGADLLMVETIFDTLNAKAALFAIEDAFETCRRAPVMISVTVTDLSGRTLSGQTVEAFWRSIQYAQPLAVGINCSLGAKAIRPYVEELAKLADVYIICFPNAGLPNDEGGFDETPEVTAALLREMAGQGWLNIVGGCCGTTAAHIGAIAEAVCNVPVRRLTQPPPHSTYSGLEALTILPDSNFMIVGERTNVTGSRKFARLILSGEFDQALDVARDQVVGGANILDVCMDEGMLDSEAAMTRFLNLIGSEPDIARLPIMVDSSRFEVIE
ncbi:MAG: homocysteine S-methyltransferase family protein, partial [Myxococcota bacterium]